MDRSFAAVTASVPPGPMLIGLQGDSGTGKTTLGIDLARRLGTSAYDIGTLFRAVVATLQVRRMNPDDVDACVALARRCGFRMDGVYAVTVCDGVTTRFKKALRLPEVSEWTSRLSAHPGHEFWAACTSMAREWIGNPDKPTVVIGRHLHLVRQMGLVFDVVRCAEESAQLRAAEDRATDEGQAAAQLLQLRNALDQQTAETLRAEGPVELLDLTGCLREEQLERALELVAKAGFEIPA